MADGVWATLSRVKSFGTFSEPSEFSARMAQGLHSLVYLCEFAFDEVGDVPAWGFAPISHFEDAPDLGEREARPLSGADELKSIGGAFVIVAVPGRRSGRDGEDADVFVVPNRLDRHPCLFGKVPDSCAHKELPLDPPLYWRVYGWAISILCSTFDRGRWEVELTLQYFDGCPNWRLALERLQHILGGDADVQLQLVDTPEDAERLAFRGSPTLLIDGRDPFADESDPVGLACRVYRTEAGAEGAPSESQLRAVLGVTA